MALAPQTELLPISSISGSAENEVQHLLAARLSEQGLEVGNWQIPVPELLTATRALALVAREHCGTR